MTSQLSTKIRWVRRRVGKLKDGKNQITTIFGDGFIVTGSPPEGFLLAADTWRGPGIGTHIHTQRHTCTHISHMWHHDM